MKEYKAEITNDLNGKKYSSSFESEKEREEYIQRVINKKALADSPDDFSVLKSEKEIEEYRLKRERDYIKNGLTFDVFVEMLIENDTAGIEEFRTKRNAIKEKHPKGI